MDVFATIITGVVVFVAGQLVLKLVIDPVHDFKRTVADIVHALAEYAGVYSNPGGAVPAIQVKASEELRKLSARLNAQMFLIPSYDTVSKVFRLPPRKAVREISGHLIYLSNAVFPSAQGLGLNSAERADKIYEALGVKPL